MSKVKFHGGGDILSEVLLPKDGINKVNATTLVKIESSSKPPNFNLEVTENIENETMPSKNEQESKDKTCEDKQNDSESLIPMSNNPLDWFGLMTPSSLLKAQDLFKKAIARSIELVNIKESIKQIPSEE